MGPGIKTDCAGEDQQQYTRPTDVEIIPVYSEKHMEHIYTAWRQNSETF
jgi:hypothetical protein